MPPAELVMHPPEHMPKALWPVWDKAWKAMLRVDALQRLGADPTEAQRSADAAAAAYAAAYHENAELIANESNAWDAYWRAQRRAEASARLGQPSAEGDALAATAALTAAKAASAASNIRPAATPRRQPTRRVRQLGGPADSGSTAAITATLFPAQLLDFS